MIGYKLGKICTETIENIHSNLYNLHKKIVFNVVETLKKKNVQWNMCVSTLNFLTKFV